VHFGQQDQALGVHEIHFAEIQNGFPAGGSGSGRMPALAEFADPRAGELPLEIEAQLVGTIVESDLQHTGRGECTIQANALFIEN
jgi:hypothetical protein